MKTKGLRAIILTVIALTCILSVLAVTVLAADGSEDAMAAIEADAELAAYKQGDTVSLTTDGYIGIPVEISVYYDSAVTAEAGYALDSTPVVLYVVNASIPRVGADSDVDIIKGMIARGYAVAVVDYLGNEKAVSPELDWSCQALRNRIKTGEFFSDKTVFPEGTYHNSFVVPAGHDLSLNHVYWEIDKHATDGTLEKIVEVWNNDFRGVWGETVIRWTDSEGNRKATQSGFDGTEPEWLDDSGAPDEAGEYIKIKHTLAEDITDCVKRDGSPIDLNLYMHVIYPTGSAEAPVLALASSSEHLAGGSSTADRPQLVGAVLRGYGAVMYDHGYVPMARNDHYGYFDGNSAEGHVSGDNNTYSIQFYNAIEINTAAMRYIRYLSLTEEDIAFDLDAIGVYGNSKGGWINFLGAPDPYATPLRRIYEGHHGETRYDNGDTADNGIIDGGEEQPWLEYNGEAIDARANLVYCGCGGAEDSIIEGQSPMFISANKGDASYYTSSNNAINYCRIYDVPTLWFENELGHTLASGEDLNYGVDMYAAFFDFVDYWLGGDAVSVVYISADVKNAPTTAPVVIKLTGSVTADEIAKVTVSSEGGTVSGYWTAAYGNTEWTFHPETLSGATEYTVTVPAGLVGSNGAASLLPYTYTFTTGEQFVSDAAVNTVTASSGTYAYFVKPETADGSSAAADRYVLRLFVANDAKNALEIYALSDFDPTSPDSATVGELIDTVYVSSGGYYDVDLTEAYADVEVGQTVAVLVKNSREVGEKTVYSASMDGALGSGMSMSGDAVYAFGTTPDSESALRLDGFNLKTSYTSESFYGNLDMQTVMASFAVLGNGNALTEADTARTFRVSFRVYDTASRYITVTLNGCTSKDYATADYNRNIYNVRTVANEWVDVSFDYTVYEPLTFGDVGLQSKTMHIKTHGYGEVSKPIYFDDFSTVEIATAAEISDAAVVMALTDTEADPCETPYGTIPDAYESVDDYPFAVFKKNATGYTFITALADPFADSTVTNYWSVDTETVIYMRRSFTATSRFTNLRQVKSGVTFDLGGNTLTANSASQTYYIVGNAPKFDVDSLFLNFKNGTVNCDGSKAFLLIGSNAAGGTVTYNVGFEDITFVRSATGTNAHPIVEFTSSTSTFTTNITYTDCVFDMQGSESTLRVFTAGNAADTAMANVVVRGGEIKLSTTSKVVLAYTQGTESSVKFGQSESGYTRLSLPVGSEAPAYELLSENGGGISFVSIGTDETDNYQLLSLSTPYGEIPAQYASAEDYPFILFKRTDDGYTFLTTLADPFADSTVTNYRDLDCEVVIYMRRSFAVSSRFTNLRQVKVGVTFDLGGNTLTANSASQTYYIVGNAPRHSVDSLFLTFKNGTINCDGSKAFLLIGSNAAATSCDYDVSFEDITFVRSASGTNAHPIVEFTTSTNTFTTDITYTDCVFDMQGATTVLRIFTAGNAANTARANVVVRGGEIRLSTTSKIAFTYVQGDDSSVCFGQSESGYTKLTLPAGTTIPGTVLVLEGGLDGRFVGSAESGSAVVTPTVINGFTVLGSLTLYNDFVYNVYVPASNEISSIILGGIEYADTSALSTEVVDGVSYYVVSVSVDVTAALQNIELEVRFGTPASLSGKWQISVVGYLERLAASTDATEAALARDALSYIRAVYAFEGLDGSEIDGIIGTDYDEGAAPDLDIEAALRTDGVDSVALLLGDAPAFLLYVKDGYDPEDFDFAIDGKRPDWEIGADDEGRVYIIVKTYAYAMTATLSWGIDGTDCFGEYNLKAYYENAKNSGDALLVSLVERLWSFSESALAYREASINS